MGGSGVTGELVVGVGLFTWRGSVVWTWTFTGSFALVSFDVADPAGLTAIGIDVGCDAALAGMVCRLTFK